MTDDSAQWKIPYRAYVKKYGTTSKTGVTPKIYRKFSKSLICIWFSKLLKVKRLNFHVD